MENQRQKTLIANARAQNTKSLKILFKSFLTFNCKNCNVISGDQ